MTDNIEIIGERFYHRYNKFNTEVLKRLGNVVSQFEGLTEEEAYELADKLKANIDIKEIEKEFDRINAKSINDIDELFNKLGDNIVKAAEVYFIAKGVEYVAFKDNKPAKEIVNDMKKEMKQTISNLNRSNIGFVTKEKGKITQFKPLSKTYNDLIDKSVLEVTTGKKDYNSAMRNTIKQLANSGVRVHEETILYSSGYNRRIDSSVRQNVLDGMRQVNMRLQREVGEQFGADGVEISAHSMCAPDHLEIQGMQYTIEEYEELNNDLVRPVGELNCYHFAYSIILGVNEPSYSKSMLDSFIEESEEEIEYEGKTYTRYEATQVQRRMETSIRRQKDQNIIAKASNDTQLVDKTKHKINQLTDKYNEFSKKAGLETQKDRLRVSGYRR